MTDLEQLIAGRQRQPRQDRNNNVPQPQTEQQPKKEPPTRDPVAEAIVKEKIQEIEKKNNIPISEVTEAQNAEKQSFISYRVLVNSAKANSFNTKDDDGFNALKSAYAEALIYKSFRDARTEIGTPVGAVIYEPVDKLKSISTLISDPSTRVLAEQTLTNINRKTPDLLMIAPTQYYTVGNQARAIDPALLNVVDLNNPKNTQTNTEIFTGKTLISPIEITRTGNIKTIKDKINKFKEYKNPFGSSSQVQYVPVLVLDRDIYNGLEDNQKIVLCNQMKAVGGRIILHQDLVKDATKLAEGTAKELTNAVQSSKRSSTSNSSTTSEVAATNSTLTNLQTTLSMGETAEVAQANNARLQEILARMQTRNANNSTATTPTTATAVGEASPAENNRTNIAATTSQSDRNPTQTTQPATTPSQRSSTALTGTVSKTTRTLDDSQTASTTTSTALTGTVGNTNTAFTITTASSPTALTGTVGSTNTALTGGTSTTALTGGGETQKLSQLQQGLALS